MAGKKKNNYMGFKGNQMMGYERALAQAGKLRETGNAYGDRANDSHQVYQPEQIRKFRQKGILTPEQAQQARGMYRGWTGTFGKPGTFSAFEKNYSMFGAPFDTGPNPMDLQRAREGWDMGLRGRDLKQYGRGIGDYAQTPTPAPTPGYGASGPRPIPGPGGAGPMTDAHGRGPNDSEYGRGTWAPGTWPGPGAGMAPPNPRTRPPDFGGPPVIEPFPPPKLGGAGPSMGDAGAPPGPSGPGGDTFEPWNMPPGANIVKPPLPGKMPPGVKGFGGGSIATDGAGGGAPFGPVPVTQGGGSGPLGRGRKRRVRRGRGGGRGAY